MIIFPRRDLLNSSMFKVIGATILLLIVSTMALNWYFSLRAADRLKSNLIYHSQSLTRALARSSRIAIFTGNKDQLTAIASDIAIDSECEIVVFFDESGTPLQRYMGKAYKGKIDFSPDEIVTQHLRDHPNIFSFFTELGTGIVVVEPVLTEAKYVYEDLFSGNFNQGGAARKENIIGYVAMVSDSKSIQNQARAMFVKDTALVVGVTVISCLLIFAVIQRIIASPLRGLVAEIRRLNENGTDSDPRDFPEMIAILRSSYNTIYGLKNTLEDKVEARTWQLELSNQDLVAQKNALASANEQLSETLAQLRSTQAQLVQSEKMAALGMMISGLSHEIKNSINFIASSLPLLEMTLNAALKEGGECPADKLNVLLGNIREGVNRTVQVVTDLATFCHNGGTVFAPTDILPGLKSAVAIVRREFRSSVSIFEEYDRVLPMVNGLGGQLNQVFLNILLNAAQSISGAGEITVKSWAENDLVHISIADTGSGIDKQIIDRIFDPFFTTKDVGKGTGLGLSISYSTIKSHGGEIIVTSTEGIGSTFEIVLPIGGS